VAYRGFRDAAVGLGTAWRKRGAIQSARRAGLWDVWRILNKALPGFRR